MALTRAGSGLPPMLADVATEALGQGHRDDPVLPRTGGPAGNARLTAWTGLVLLVLFLAELVTLIDVQGLISWHVVLGTVLVPPALLKTASTTWRIVRYYRRNPPYVEAGPPPMLLRLLGPAVVASTLALLASGLLLIVLGPRSSRTVLVSALGQQVDWVTVHQGLFVVWGVVTGLHVLARLVPAFRLTMVRGATGPSVAGSGRRAVAVVVSLAVAVASAAIVLAASGSWRNDQGFREFNQGGENDGAPAVIIPG